MNRIGQNNEDQFQMLCLAIAGTSSGMCLYKSDNAKEQTAIAQRLCSVVKKSCCILDMSKIDTDKLPDDIGKLRDLLRGEEAAETVILCNLQLCGEALGDEKYIQRLNYMRDQLSAMRKMWVFGMTNYFAVMLGREARDLYSCIMNHFEFIEEEKESPLAFAQLELVGDKKRSLLKFKELQERIAHKGLDDAKTELQLELITEWNRIFDCCNSNIKKQIKEAVRNVEEHMKHIIFSPNDCIVYQEIAKAWSHLGDNKKALEVAKLIEANAKNLLPAFGKEMAGIYRMLGIIYYYLRETARAEEYINNALAYYNTQKESSLVRMDIMNVLAQIKILNDETEEARAMYEWMIQETERGYGKNCYYLIALWNNFGKLQAVLGRYSEALGCYHNADKISAGNEGYVYWRFHILINMGIVYIRIGNYNKAVYYLEEAKRISGKLDISLINTKKKKSIDEMLEECYKKVR